MKFEVLRTCSKCAGKGKVNVVSAERMREARVASGLSLTTVAKRLKLSPPYISDVERGNRNPTPKIVKFYEQLYEIQCDE